MSASPATKQNAFAGCDQEPIHIPGTIQPHGVLLILDQNGYVNQCSANLNELLGVEIEQALGSPLEALVGTDAGSLIISTIENERLENNPVFLERAFINNAWFNIIVHRRGGLTLVELEAVNQGSSLLVSGVYPTLSRSVASLQQPLSLAELLDTSAREVHKLTTFDRVLIYQFGPDWAGTVVAEARTDLLPSYMDLRFPESDIPRQARELYRLNRTRLIADADYRPVPIVPTTNPITGRTPDLTYSALRSVSPVHVEYLKNMGTAASMSISIIRDGELWGLIACHHHAPARVPVQIRFACELVAQVLSSQLAAVGEHSASALRAELAASQQRLLVQLAAAESFVDTIVANAEDMLRCVRANGAAVVFQDRCEVMGRTPSPDEVRELAAWVSNQPDKDIFVSGELSQKFPPGEAYSQIASGLLAVSISETDVGYLLWFRPDKSTEVKWAGNPNKIEVMIDGQYHPRKSFQIWTEREQGRSQPWDPVEFESARTFRAAVVNLVLKKAEALAALSEDLQRTSSELSELEAFSYSVSHDLRAPFRHIIGYAEILREDATITGENRRYLETIIASASFGGLLIDNLLSFARIARSKLDLQPVSMKYLAEDVLHSIVLENPGRLIDWTTGNLPEVTADPFFIRLALENLVRNAVKYTRPRARAEIDVGVIQECSDEPVIFVKDNGVGFDMQFKDKLFGVFQRLHHFEDFEGTGIGLATVARIVDRHGGKVWAFGEVDGGATFYFSLPCPSASKEEQ